jgi:hypothetical protein
MDEKVEVPVLSAAVIETSCALLATYDSITIPAASDVVMLEKNGRTCVPVSVGGLILCITKVTVAPMAVSANCVIVKMFFPSHRTGNAVVHPMAVLSTA